MGEYQAITRQRFLAHLQDSELLPLGSVVLVGYSGGADSTCLVHLLHDAGFSLVAAHLHHGQRPEADKELELCAAFCEGLGVPFVSGRADVPRMARELRLGLEEAGREARYEFFQTAATRTGCEIIATAHTKDDNVETILANIARGSGLAGLAGIPARRDNVVRPLLPFTREQTERYCKQHGFWTHEDPANTDLAFTRARIRSKVVPQFRKINPEFYATVERLSETARGESEFLDRMAAAALEKAEVRLNEAIPWLTEHSECAFDRTLLLHLPEVLLKRALRLVVRFVGGTLDFKCTRIAAEGVGSGARGSVTAESGRSVLEWDASLVTARVVEQIAPFRFNLTIPGETISNEFGWQIVADDVVEWSEPSRASLEAQIDMEKSKGQLHFRSCKAGDQMRPLGFGGHRKVADLMAEAGLTSNARRRLPVVCDMAGPIWIPAVCLDERVRPSSESKRVLGLRFEASKLESKP